MPEEDFQTKGTTMIKTLISIGGTSTGLILDRQILELLKLEQGAQVELALDSTTRTLTIRPADANAVQRREEFRRAQKQVLGRHGNAFRKLSKR
jgi:antitoxin component of MazEF toxin-antitoxin module